MSIEVNEAQSALDDLEAAKPKCCMTDEQFEQRIHSALDKWFLNLARELMPRVRKLKVEKVLERWETKVNEVN